MKIAASAVNLASLHRYTELYTRRESLRLWVGQRPSPPGPNPTGAPASSPSPTGKAAVKGEPPVAAAIAEELVNDLIPRWPSRNLRMEEGQNPLPEKILRTLAKKASDAGMDDQGAGLTPELRLVKLLLERLFGIKVQLISLPEEQGAPGSSSSTPPRQGWGLEYDLQETYYEAEAVSFSASGLIRTADGKEIQFSLHLQMSREFLQQRRLNLRAGDAVDPLIVHFEGTAAQLSSARFAFDLDMDGTPEEIASPGPGSAFLALDLNGDDQINDGGELFGPRTGDGFAELAEHDEDQNGWIDENDAVYDRLRLWPGGLQGRAPLATLRQKGIGAIYLGREPTPFAIKDAQNNPQGYLVASGVYLKEDGSAGSIQQVNLLA